MKHKLLSIGELSGITGVHISSLRYYDRIGILKPAYIDTETNYRYYTNSQIGIVEAIQACVEMDIPLKQYLDFTENDGQTIHVEQLLEFGKIQAQKKMQAITAGLKRIELLQKEIAHSNLLLCATSPIIYEVPKKKYFVTPIDKSIYDSNYMSLDRLHIIATEKGYSVGQELGLMYIFNANKVERYQFIEITNSSKGRKKELITIPASNFIATVVDTDSIENAPDIFAEQFAKDYAKIVIETELFTGNADVEKPLYELRCSLTP